MIAVFSLAIMKGERREKFIFLVENNFRGRAVKLWGRSVSVWFRRRYISILNVLFYGFLIFKLTNALQYATVADRQSL
jgi:hypothetical protein